MEGHELIEIMEVIILPIVLYAVSLLAKMNKDLHTIKITLFGATNDGGIHMDIRELKQHFSEVHTAVGKIDIIQEDVKELRVDVDQLDLYLHRGGRSD